MQTLRNVSENPSRLVLGWGQPQQVLHAEEDAATRAALLLELVPASGTHLPLEAFAHCMFLCVSSPESFCPLLGDRTLGFCSVRGQAALRKTEVSPQACMS